MYDSRGIALVTTLILGLTAVVFIGALMFMLIRGTGMSASEKKYAIALEAAKGGVELITTSILSGEELTCNGGLTCTPCPTTENNNCKIDLSISELGGYKIEAFLLDKQELSTYAIYTIRVKAQQSTNPKEKAVVEFVYKVE